MRFLLVAAVVPALVSPAFAGTQSVARQWNEENLEAIRHDFARPTVHARNLYHVASAMWDAWAAYDAVADQIFHHERISPPAGYTQQEAREEAMSFAAYRVLLARYAGSPGGSETLASLDARMAALGHNAAYTATIGTSPAALGNRVAVTVLFKGIGDGANEAGGFANLYYEPVNDPILPDLPGNPDISDLNRWQPIALDYFVDQGGNVIVGGYPAALSPEWGIVTPFCLRTADLTVYPFAGSDDFDWWVYHDPGPPPHFGDAGPFGDSGMTSDEYYRWGFELVSIWSSHLDPADGVMIDISPASLGNSPLPDVDDFESYYDLYEGSDWSAGYVENPVTKTPYTPQLVPRGDYARILAEFWADGPASETPPGHWFSILNYVMDHPLFEKRLGGEGPLLDNLEFDVKAYVAMGGAMHDVAVSAWGIKGYYDYLRPVSAIRWMADQGQSSDMGQPSYHPDGIRLHPGFIEVVTAASAMPGERHEHLAGSIGKIALNAWRGPDFIDDPETDVAGVGWILAENWWPYQRPSFVTPPFPGYISGHSTFSRGAAEFMTLMTGSPYFPGGLGEFHCGQNEFLVFEDGPSVECTLQWASYRDASDQTSMSRIWGGIHPPADDLPGRHIGLEIGPDAWHCSVAYFEGRITCPADVTGDRLVGVSDMKAVIGAWGTEGPSSTDLDMDGTVNVLDLLQLLGSWGACPDH